MRPRTISLVLAVLSILLIGMVEGAMAQRRIEAGSVLNITVLGRPELSQSVTVNEDGTTDYPILGSFEVTGMTPEELTDLLMRVLSRIVDRPQVFVNLSEQSFIRARVKGAVLNPGEVVLSSPVDVLDAVAEAGGATNQGDMRRVRIVSEVDGVQSERIVDLVEYATQSRADYDPIRLGIGDLVIVPTLSPDSFIRVLGEVSSPGPYVPNSLATIVDLIYQAGGPTRQADVGDVRLLRRVDGRVEETRYNLRDMLKTNLDLPPVQGGDVIIMGYLEEWEDFSFWVGVLRDFALLASSIVLLSRI